MTKNRNLCNTDQSGRYRLFAANLQTEMTVMKRANAGGRTERANEISIVFRPPAWQR